MKATFTLFLHNFPNLTIHKLEVPFDKLDTFFEFMENKKIHCRRYQYDIVDKNLLTEILLRFS